MKHKDFLVTLFGCICLVSGLSIFGSYYFLDSKMQKQIDENIKNSTIFIEKSSNTVKAEKFNDSGQNYTLYDFQEAVESLSADQEIEEVVSYSNVLEIPHLNIKAYVNDGSDKASLSGGVGRHINTAEIGKPGNCVIAGHSSETYNCIFNGLEQGINLLDEFFLYDREGIKHRYIVTNKFICSPDSVGILHNSGEGISTTTIYTCTNKGRQRFVIVGKEFTDIELAEYIKEQESIYINNMININELVDFGSINDIIDIRHMFKEKIYNVKFLHSDIEKINTGLYGVALGFDAFDKEHLYDIDYAMGIGFVLDNLDGAINYNDLISVLGIGFGVEDFDTSIFNDFSKYDLDYDFGIGFRIDGSNDLTNQDLNYNLGIGFSIGGEDDDVSED